MRQDADERRTERAAAGTSEHAPSCDEWSDRHRRRNRRCTRTQALTGGICSTICRVLHKRRWTAGTAFLIVLASVTAYTFTVTPIYEARTRLLIEAEGPNVINFTEVIDEQRTRADYYQTQYSILQSRQLARKTIDALQLWDSPHLGGQPRAGVVATLFGGRNRPRRRTSRTRARRRRSRARSTASWTI